MKEVGVYQGSSIPASSTVGVGYRLLALIIDSLALLVVICPLTIISLIAGDGNASGFTGAGGALNGITTIVTLAYFIVMEATRGATLGKMALGLRVVKSDGSAMDWGASIVRNLLRLVDLFPYFIPYLLGAILIWTSPTHQRLGDRVAGTLVIRKDAVPEITGFETQRF